jgi:hypothetical protein
MADFDTIISNLATAVNQAQDTGNYYSGLPSTLEGINRELQGITQQIQNILADLAEKNELVQTNQEQIRVLNGQSAAANEELGRLQTADTENKNIIRGLRQGQQELEQSHVQQVAKFATDMELLKKEQQSTLQQEKQAADQNNATLRKELEAREAEIENRFNTLLAQKQREDAEYKQKMEQLSQQVREAQQQANALNQAIAAKTAESSGLSSNLAALQSENNTLKQQMNKASALMVDATTLLGNLKPENAAAIKQQIQSLQASIGEINRILGSGSRSGANGPSAGQQATGDDMIPLRQVNIQLSDALSELNRKAKQNPRNMFGASKFVKAQNELKALQERDSYTIENIQKILNNVGFTSDGTLKGGRKTRRKHKKQNKKTKKQRGGYHYNEHARRRKITTTSSVRNSRSKRSSRRSSSR